MRTDKTISVVIPVFNVEAYLEQCVTSIVKQSYPNLEIILVDDGSTDKSGIICDMLQTTDSRIRTIHKQNGGLSDARNCGLHASKGQLICFIDSDDYVDENMINILYDVIETNDCDIAVSNYHDVYCGIIKNKSYTLQTNFYSSREAFYHFLKSDKDGFVVAWNKLYRKQLFTSNRIEYPKGKIHEDCFTSYRLYLASKKIAYVDAPLYYYRRRKGSISTSSDAVKAYDIVTAYEEILLLTERFYPEFVGLARFDCIKANLQTVHRCNIKKEEDIHILDKCRNNMRSLLNKNLFSYSLKKMIQAEFFSLMPLLYLRVYSFLKGVAFPRVQLSMNRLLRAVSEVSNHL